MGQLVQLIAQETSLVCEKVREPCSARPSMSVGQGEIKQSSAGLVLHQPEEGEAE